MKATTKKTIILMLVSFLTINFGFGQTVNNNPIASNTVCVGAQVSVNFYVTGTSTITPYGSYDVMISSIGGVAPYTAISSTVACTSWYSTTTPGTLTTTVPALADGSYAIFVKHSSISVSNTVKTTIVIQNLPTASTITASGSIALCPNASVVLNSSAVTNNIWNTTATTQSISVNSAGSYFVSNTNQCGASNSNTITVTANATPTITVNSGAVCLGKSFTLTPTGANTYTYSSGSAVVTPSANASYSITGTDANGCVSDTAVSNVIVNALPSLTVTVMSPTVCSGIADTLVVHGANTYTWSTGSTGHILYTNLTATTHYTVTGTDVNGCKNTDTATVIVTNCSTTGINNVANKQTINNVYPVPASDVLNIELININENEKANLVLYSIDGQVVLNQTIETASTTTIHVDNIQNGVYMLEVVTNNYKSTKRIIVAH